MSFAEDMGYDAYDVEDGYEARILEWKDGYHITKEGKRIELSNMEISHLENTIKFFEGLDTQPLKEELKNRII